MNKFYGKAQTILLPSNTRDVSNILKTCNSNKIPIHIQGGNTGLVGGAVASNAEVLMSMEKLNKIKNFCYKRGVIHCQSGCILQVLDEHVNEKGWIMPLDLGAKGSCQIGGNIATNAGGIRFFKYGSLHQNIVGIKAIINTILITKPMRNSFSLHKSDQIRSRGLHIWCILHLL